ncbi:MAG: ABC transporter substrate-binding protein [Moraxellaceae bacterium]|nr:ABC transporter substrate-binding protein [Moraxellaceae bacterium]
MLKLRLGLTASLDERRTVHTIGFLDTIKHFNEAHGFPFHIIWVDDKAAAESASSAAHLLVRQKADVVVGHFASAAAAAALPVYAGHGLPVFLPAATHCHLTQTCSNVFRLCKTDSDLARRLVGYMQVHAYRQLDLRHDGSLHGHALSDLILEEWGGEVGSGRDSVVVFCGSFEKSSEFLQTLRALGDARDIWLTDDAFCPQLLDHLPPGECRVYVVGYDTSVMNAICHAFEKSYQLRFGYKPGTYYYSTYAALEICLQLARLPRAQWLSRLSSGIWKTHFAELGFRYGESGFGEISLWQPVCSRPPQMIGSAVA